LIGTAGTVNTGAIDDLQALASWRLKRIYGSMSMAASARSSPSLLGTHIASPGSRMQIRWHSIRINGCMLHSRPAAL
jgi:hypothetical protein